MPAACAPRLNSRPCWPRAEPQPRPHGEPAAPRTQTFRTELPARSARHRAHHRRHRSSTRRYDRRDRPGAGRADPTSDRTHRPHRRAGDRSRSRGVAADRISARAAVSDRRRCARLRLVRDQRNAADRRQPAVQHLLAAAVRADAARRPRARPALHAAEGSGRPHGGVARQPHLWAAVGHAAVTLPADQALRCRARRVPARAGGDLEHRAHAAAAGRAPPGRQTRGSSHKSYRRHSASAARPCAMRCPNWRPSTSSARPRSIPRPVPKRFRWTTSRALPRPSRPHRKATSAPTG